MKVICPHCNGRVFISVAIRGRLKKLRDTEAKCLRCNRYFKLHLVEYDVKSPQITVEK